MTKVYIDSNTLLDDAYNMAITIFESGFRPDFIVGVWRGGCPVGIAVQEVFEYLGVKTDHIAIRTSSYIGIGERNKQVQVYGLSYLLNRLTADKNALLIIDDIHDTGLSIDQIINDLHQRSNNLSLDIKIATPYFKPANNKTSRTPDFYIHENNNWIVFPHELAGLSDQEILLEKPGIKTIAQRLVSLKNNQ